MSEPKASNAFSCFLSMFRILCTPTTPLMIPLIFVIYCAVLYPAGENRIAQSQRIAFPRQSENLRCELIKKVRDVLIEKVGGLPINRLGLSAIEFEAKPKNGAIDSFFSASTKPELHVLTPDHEKFRPSYSAELTTRERSDDALKCSDKAEFKTIIKAQLPIPSSQISNRSVNAEFPPYVKSNATAQTSGEISPVRHKDADLVYARRIQAMYDKEESTLSTFEQSGISGPKKRSVPRNLAVSKLPKRHKIDNFFARKPK